MDAVAWALAGSSVETPTTLLWATLTGLEDDDSDDAEGNPGYERDLEQRRRDCETVRRLLCNGDVSADERDNHGASLLYHALEYDHRHPPEMVRIVVEAGADVNAPTHSSSCNEWPLDCELWLELDGPFAEVNRRKRDYLVHHGASHSPAVAARIAVEAAEADEAARARQAANEAADAALEKRLREARSQRQAESVPTWESVG
jgi:hypothetical protein